MLFSLLQWYAGLIYLPIDQLHLLLFFGFILGNGSRLFQIFTNYKNGHTGLLSLPTVFLNVMGAIARVFTTLQETGDLNILMTYLIGIIINITLFGQLIYYYKNTKKVLKKKTQ